MVVGIIGAGASGMTAALWAAQNPNVQVVLMERQARIGRKLQATGNGRCNLSNENFHISHYHGEDPSFTEQVFSQFGVEDTLGWFAGLGLCTVTEASGKVYPYSDQANSVVDVLRLALNKDNIALRLGFDVEKIRSAPEGFIVQSKEETVVCDRLIVACGGLAGTKLGGTMSGYKLLSKLGHRSTKLRPTLVQIQSSFKSLASLKGVRANCKVEILHEDKMFAQSRGELQFTEQGLSGPVIFEISRDVCAASGSWIARLDFLPQWDENRVLAHLKSRAAQNYPVEDILTGVLHNRLGRVLTQCAGIKGKAYCRDLSDNEFAELCRCVKSLEVELTEPLGMESAQVTAGGVLTADFDPETLESKKIPGLYVCGELLDVDGDCGGYNLQWAWSSGYVAGKNAGKDTK